MKTYRHCFEIRIQGLKKEENLKVPLSKTPKTHIKLVNIFLLPV
jgi:hypothetical protein